LHPAVKQRRIAGLHELETAIHAAVVGYPAVNVAESLGQHPPAGGRPLVNRPWPGNVPLDHHVKHETRLVIARVKCQALFDLV
jgi:hypothetical protein